MYGQRIIDGVLFGYCKTDVFWVVRIKDGVRTLYGIALAKYPIGEYFKDSTADDVFDYFKDRLITA